MMIILVAAVALAAPLVADPMNDFKDSGPQGSFQRFDEQQPRAFETFAGEFPRRVDAEFAAGAISLVRDTTFMPRWGSSI